MDMATILIITYFILAVIAVAVVLNIIHRRQIKKEKKIIEKLDKEKNIIASTPILLELSKVEEIIKTEKMEEKYTEFKMRFEDIQTNRITKINDMITELDFLTLSKDRNKYQHKLISTELEIYKVKEVTNNLLYEIKDITLSEEKYRNIITKLKAKYRNIVKTFEDRKVDYQDIAKTIELQFENIEKRFYDFEKIMEANEYSEVIHIVKAIETMVDHIEVVVNEIPNILLLAKELIPKRIEEIKEIYDDMNSKGYPLSYLNLEYNISETEKKINAILDKIKVLNLDDSLFELKTMLNYFDSLFKDFEIEKSNKKIFEENRLAFENKIRKTNKIVEDIYNQIEDIKSMYNLTDDDLSSLTNVNDLLLEINIDYKELTKQNKEKTSSYTAMNSKLEELSNRLKLLEEELDNSLKSLGSMYDDEVRAKEQLDKIEDLLKQSKINIRSYKLPIISNNYFVELAEAKEAIEEIVKELEKKPITIKVLNTRVDTARDLVLKLFNTTNEMIKYAFLSEMIIVYGNRYRSADKEIDEKLSKAEILFFKGNYKKSLNLSIETLQKVEPDIEKKLLEEYNMIN